MKEKNIKEKTQQKKKMGLTTKIFVALIAGAILGIILCILCFSWFISGIVMIYHSFPRVSQEERFARQQALGTAS